MREVSRGVRAALDAPNADAYLRDLGTGLHGLLIEHLRKFCVSSLGAYMLKNDLTAYHEVVRACIPALADQYALLAALATLFIVRPENLRVCLQEGLLGRLGGTSAIQFVAQREDFKRERLDQMFPEIDVTNHGLANFFALTAADI